MKYNTISIVIPLLNEDKSLTTLYEKIRTVMSETGYSFEVVFVDDGSNDNSFAVLKQLYALNKSSVCIIQFTRNYGKSAALNAGFTYAKGEVIVTMDADLQDDPQAIPGMVKLLEEGWEVVSGWKKIRHDPLSKTAPSKLWNALTAVISGVKLHDFNCGIKAYIAEAAKSLEIYGDRHRYLPALAHWNGYKVTEMVVPHHPRQFGKSKYGLSRISGLFDLFTLLFLKKYLLHPLHFFGVLGIAFCFLGGGVLSYFGIDWIISGTMRLRPLVLLSIGSIIMGIQFISIGLLGEMIVHTQRKSIYQIKQSVGHEQGT